MVKTAMPLRLPRRRPTAADAWQAILADRDPDPPAWRKGWGMGLGTADVIRHMQTILGLRPSDLERLRQALIPHLHPGDAHALAWLLRPHRPDWPADAADAPTAGPAPEDAADAFRALPADIRRLLTDANPKRRAAGLVKAARAGVPEATLTAFAAAQGDTEGAPGLAAWATKAAQGGAGRAG